MAHLFLSLCLKSVEEDSSYEQRREARRRQRELNRLAREGKVCVYVRMCELCCKLQVLYWTVIPGIGHSFCEFFRRMYSMCKHRCILHTYMNMYTYVCTYVRMHHDQG